MSTPEERKAARANWPIRMVRLGDDSEPVLAKPQEAWDAVFSITAMVYQLAGKLDVPLPRERWPIRVLRPGEPRDD